ncbi:hypothetical protein ACFQ4C_02500 [Larkinella insperata]|uniref:Uncharacterized protein n=1 Tax=Larkinella insperata TaxID=332158 RepID=A0ABW3Q2F5_9BACT|nr:hypothetical protein [Larkinella insperata]
MNSLFRTLLLGLLGGFMGPGSAAQAPECRPEDAQRIQTPWVRKPDALGAMDPAFPRKSLPVVFERQDKIIRLLQKAYPNPQGLEARAYRLIRNDPANEYQLMPAGSPLRYSVTTYYLHYWCFRGKPERSHETGTWIECHVNSLWQFMDSVSEREYLLANGQQIYYMPEVIGELKGYPVYSKQTGWNNQKHESILLVPGNRLPVRPVSREEFVRSLQRYIQNYLKENEETTHKLEAALKETLAFADQSTAFKTAAEREKYKEENRRSVENGRIKRDQSAQRFRDNFQRLDALLAAMSPQERAAQAVIADPYGMLTNRRGLGTFEEQAPKGRPLVTHDLKYGDPGLPRHAIQSIQLLMKYETSADMVAKREMIRQFRENIDLDGLKALLESGGN